MLWIDWCGLEVWGERATHIRKRCKRVALRCREPVQPPRLSKVDRPAMAGVVHEAETILRTGDALLCREPKQPPRLGQVYRPAIAGAVHAPEIMLRLSITLRCREPVQPSNLSKVLCAALGLLLLR